ncbi:uncharacterized protein LOC112884519 [Panicum hallii]|uniref:uncharacterized protein LOC112884519 n=1 Tax=Panicum hallii TaxID=206008 RepID=UPI000DF4DC8D|nr:uncharacterized protein LOC112884519 [Panicum hallii]
MHLLRSLKLFFRPSTCHQHVSNGNEVPNPRHDQEPAELDYLTSTFWLNAQLVRCLNGSVSGAMQSGWEQVQQKNDAGSESFSAIHQETSELAALMCWLTNLLKSDQRRSMISTDNLRRHAIRVLSMTCQRAGTARLRFQWLAGGHATQRRRHRRPDPPARGDPAAPTATWARASGRPVIADCSAGPS